MITLEQAMRTTIIQNDNREHWREGDTPEGIAQQIVDEAKELIVELNRSFVTGEVFPVVGEVGDVLFLVTKFCYMTGIEPAHALDYKNKRNARKYDDAMGNDGYNREEATLLQKQAWKASGGDEAFSHVYLDFLAHNAD